MVRLNQIRSFRLAVKLIILVILLFAGSAWVGELGDRVYSPEGRAKLINHWAASGEICRVLGHKWEVRNGREPLTIGGSVAIRRCLICPKVEKKYVTMKEEWR